MVDIIRNENKEIIQRKIYPNDIPYLLNNRYPYVLNGQEGIDEKVKENNINYNNINTHTVSKEIFLENVYLYDFEYKELVNEYGETKAKKCIEELSLYKKSKGVEYKSDFATIKRWVVARVEEIEERQEKRSNNKKKSNRFNYEQRQYSAEFFESLYDNIPCDRIPCSEKEMDQLFNILDIKKSFVSEVIMETYYGDKDFRPLAAKHEFTVTMILVIRYFLLNKMEKDCELACIHLAFSGKFYPSNHFASYPTATPSRPVMEYVVNNKHSKKNVNKIYKKGLAKFIALQVLLDFYSAWSESVFVLVTDIGQFLL